MLIYYECTNAKKSNKNIFQKLALNFYTSIVYKNVMILDSNTPAPFHVWNSVMISCRGWQIIASEFDSQ